MAWDLDVAKRSPTNSDSQAAGEQERSWQYKISGIAWARNQECSVFQLISYGRAAWSCYISVCPSDGFCLIAPVAGNDDQRFYR